MSSFSIARFMAKKIIPYIVAVALIGTVAVVVLPNSFPVQLEGAKQQWQLEHNKTTNDIPTLDDLKPYMKLTSRSEIPPCPQGGTYIPGRVGEPPRCSLGGEQHTLPQ